MTDPIADMLTRIRNAVLSRQRVTVMPYSTLKLRIAELLHKEGWVGSVRTSGTAPHQTIEVALLYNTAGKPVLTHLKRISTVGRRRYVKADHIPTVLNGFGMAIISTPQGVITDREARKRRVGGEWMCEVS